MAPWPHAPSAFPLDFRAPRPYGLRMIRAGFPLLALLTAGLPLLAAEQPMGLILATPEQLRGIPLASTPFSGEELPAQADLSATFPRPQHQGRQNSCVGWSVAYALKSYQEQVEERRPLVRRDGQIDADRVFSPAFIYNQINQGRDGGCSIIDALNMLHNTGAAPWSAMPYDPSDFRRAPPPGAYESARRYRIDFWRQVNPRDPREIKAQINAGYPVIIGATLDEGFCAARQGEIWRDTRGQIRGAHAMVVVGYDDRRSAFKLFNSWGTEWGDQGFGWVDYGHFGRVCNEAYVAKDARNGPAPVESPTWTPPPPPVSNPFDQVQFSIVQVMHNAIMPDRPQDGYYLRLDGQLAIPGGVGSVDQVVVNFWYDAGGGAKGQPVPALNPTYATVYNQAACGTGRYPIPPQGLNVGWSAWIPYGMLAAPSGGYVMGPFGATYQMRSTAMIAEAVLFVDNFGVKTAMPVPFILNR
jgi:hypothetical protein